MGLLLRRHRLQSNAAAEALGGVGMSARVHCQLNRRRRIVKADICDRHHLPVRAGDKRRQSALFFNGLLEPESYLRVAFPDKVREAIKDEMAENGITEQDLREMAEKLHPSPTKQ
jgi:hypothetical protein